jgi:hypothetical protein
MTDTCYDVTLTGANVDDGACLFRSMEVILHLDEAQYQTLLTKINPNPDTDTTSPYDFDLYELGDFDTTIIDLGVVKSSIYDDLDEDEEPEEVDEPMLLGSYWKIEAVEIIE